MLSRSIRTVGVARLVAPRFVPSAGYATRAISNPTLKGLETRWESMSSEERSDIVSQLAERQKDSWKELTEAEKRAAWYISYGSWGPRKVVHPPGSVKKIVLGVFGIVSGAVALMALIKSVTPDLPPTMSKEWQEASNEILKERNANPFSGYNQIQSPSRGLPESEGDDDE